jgi:hypothetical protein
VLNKADPGRLRFLPAESRRIAALPKTRARSAAHTSLIGRRPRRPQRPFSNDTDLVALFPELPGVPRTRVADQQRLMRRKIERMHLAVRLNVAHQRAIAARRRAATHQAKAQWAATRRRMK